MLVGILSFWLLVLGYGKDGNNQAQTRSMYLYIALASISSLKSTHSLNVGHPKRNGKAHHLPTNEFQQPAGSGASLLFVSGMGTYIINCLNDFAAKQG